MRETIQDEHVVGLKEWAKDETLENINVKWREKPTKENQECLVLWTPKGRGLKKESNQLSDAIERATLKGHNSQTFQDFICFP